MRRFALVTLLCLTVTVAVYFGWNKLSVENIASLNASDATAKAGAHANPAGGESNAHGKSRSIAVVTTTAQAGALPNVRSTIGYVRSLASTELATETSGIVVSLNARDGAEVKTGDLLAKLDDRAAKAAIAKDRAALARDTATLDDARLTLQRTQKLETGGAATQQALDDGRSTVASAEATVGVDQAALDADQVVLDKTEIRAPFDGRLGAFEVSVGSLAQPSTSIVSIVQTKPVYAEFSLAETDLSLLRQAMASGQLKVKVTPSLAPAGTTPVEGPIVFIDNQVDAASATVRLRALLDNPAGALWPNQSIDVTIEAGSLDPLVLVPNVAVQPREDGSIVYVVGPDSTVEVRKVEVALRSETQAGLSAGLKPGESVVVEGQLDLLNGTHVRGDHAPPPGKTPSDATSAAADPAGRS